MKELGNKKSFVSSRNQTSFTLAPDYPIKLLYPETILCKAILLDNLVPEWVELIPAGVNIKGRDGRIFNNTDPAKVIEAFKNNGAFLPLDWEHSTEIKGPKGEEAPAAGWIVELQVKNGGSIWGKIDWTRRGAEVVRQKEYRYLSPVFLLEKKSKNIVALLSAGLTNNPNLRLTALNRVEVEKEIEIMNLKEFCLLLGLSETATEEEVKTAINHMLVGINDNKKREVELNSALVTALSSLEEIKSEMAMMKTKNVELSSSSSVESTMPTLDKFVPRQDYEVAIQRAKNAEKEIAEHKRIAIELEIFSEIDKALKSKKITPATVDYHKAQCAQEGGLERFKKYVDDAPTLVIDTNLSKKKFPEDKDVLTDQEKAICMQTGISEEEYKAAGKSVSRT
jgi:phage I-like protein